MTKRKRAIQIAVIIGLITAAYIPALLHWTLGITLSNYLVSQRIIIHIGLFTAWGGSVKHRIVQRQVRIYLITIAALIIFWLLARSFKYYLIEDVNILRYLWYSYYIPMLLIPSLGVLVALTLRKPERYRLPHLWVGFVVVPTIILLLLVLANDMHQLIFAFNGDIWTDKNYSYQPVYWIVLAWEILSGCTAMGILIAKTRTPRTRKVLWQPIVPLFLSVLYGILYIAEWPLLCLFANDMTFMFCLFFTLTLESCIQCGLIQSNARYTKLFHASSLGVRIVDKDCTSLISSANARFVSEQTLLELQQAPVLLSDGTRLSSAPISGGRNVVWQEDVSELIDIVAQLEDTYELLQGENTILAEEYRTNSTRQSLVEKNRLYNKVQTQTKGQIEKIEQLTEQLSLTENPKEACKLISHIAVITAYVKRRNNLIFIAEESGLISACEMEYCLRESISNLELAGVVCKLRIELPEALSFEQVTFLYDRFEILVEIAFKTLKSLHISVFMNDETPMMAIILQCDEDLAALADEYFNLVRESDNEWTLTCVAPASDAKGGETGVYHLAEVGQDEAVVLVL